MKIGCCGFPIAMEKYFEIFEVVEVQKTFYKPPNPKTANKWRERAPENFEFTVKAWQVITHPLSSPTYRKTELSLRDAGFFKPIKEVFEAWNITKEISKVLKAKFILFQTPRSFKEREENIKNMKEFFNTIEKNFIFGWEPRGWRNETVKRVCQELSLIHVVDPFENSPTWGELKYFRVHKNHSEEEIYSLINKADYIMFNNPFMLRDAEKLKKRRDEVEGKNYRNSKKLSF
ncbi:MAG: DUF72 domain-containing protein [Archaeoglobaceae archaeon]|nr:DUF72 domain-containing protein [Archaeoglobaceae archaeon]MDW7989383.1 DUF72 domain-containing protein [Archaeoglobaceae archaeon]